MRARTWRVVAALTALAALTGACGDDDDAADDTNEATTTTAAEGGEPEAIEVTAIDYAFEGLPDEVDAGATFSLTNSSDAEVHEMVTWRLPEGEERSLEEIEALSNEEFDQLVGGPPSFVLVALPSEEGQVVVPPGGEATAAEAGRYLVACFIPVGSDVEAYRQAIETGAQEPPAPPPGATFHNERGMVGEFTVS